MSKTYHREFSAETEHAGRRMVLVGQWMNLGAYYRADDGTAWSFSACTGSWSNCGSFEDFMARFQAGKYRGELNREAVV